MTEKASVVGSTKSGSVEINADEKNLYIEGDNSLSTKQVQLLKSPEYKAAYRQWLRVGGDFSRLPLQAAKFLQEAVDQSGGFLVPEEMLNRIVQKQPAPTQFLSKVQQFNTSRDALVIPRVVYDTDNIFSTGIRVTKTGENPASATTSVVVDPLFGSVRIPVQTWMMQLAITSDMIEDSAFPLESWVAGKFGETIELLKESQSLNGTGVGENLGLVTALKRGATGDPTYTANGGTTAISPDKLIALQRSIPPQYANNPGIGWVMEYNNVSAAIAQLKDSQNRYLFSMGGASDGGLQNAGRRIDTLLGDPILYSQFSDAASSNNFPVLYGDFSGYYFLNRVGFSLRVLTEVGATQNQIILLGRVRFGGQPVENWKMKGLKYAAS
jgi:hypothetical protein